MIEVVVAHEHVRHRLWRDTLRPKRIEDQRTGGHEAGINDDRRVAIADEDDGAADAIAGVAGVQDVECRHCWMVGAGPVGRGPSRVPGSPAHARGCWQTAANAR